MEPREFARLENMCQSRFVEAGSCFHVCSQENHPVLFHNEEEFKAAMNVVAFSALCFPRLKVYTFEVMANHFHFLMAGNRDEIGLFIRSLVTKLSSFPELQTSSIDTKALKFKVLGIDSLENLRNVIAYINRNGAVVYPDENVFTYRWGANRYFFNREARLRYAESGHLAKQTEKRAMTRSHTLDNQEHIVILDGHIAPLCFCEVSEAELFFRNSRHYFSKVSKNIESQRDIAKMIGENVFYTDDDLASLIASVCAREYNVKRAAELPASAKVELAKKLHFEYNSSDKQISRLLKISLELVASLFPG